MNGQIVYTKESEDLFLNLDRKLILLKYKSYHKCSGIINKSSHP